MTDCMSKTFKFPALKNRKIEALFSGGSITSDGGSLLLRQVEQKIKLLKRVANPNISWPHKFISLETSFSSNNWKK